MPHLPPKLLDWPILKSTPVSFWPISSIFLPQAQMASHSTLEERNWPYLFDLSEYLIYWKFHLLGSPLSTPCSCRSIEWLLLSLFHLQRVSVCSVECYFGNCFAPISDWWLVGFGYRGLSYFYPYYQGYSVVDEVSCCSPVADSFVGSAAHRRVSLRSVSGFHRWDCGAWSESCPWFPASWREAEELRWACLCWSRTVEAGPVCRQRC